MNPVSAKPLDATPPVRHVIVCGGTVAEWAAATEGQWTERLTELGKVADHVAARWLILRPFGGTPDASLLVRTQSVGSCVVEAQPDCDGRERFVRAAAALHASHQSITENAIDGLLNAPADVDPDLVVIVAASRCTPPSLVWELAYSELVYVDVAWRDFGAAHLEEAIASYARRHRRFGGID